MKTRLLEKKDFYFSQLKETWQIPSHIRHFPGSNPRSVERKDLSWIEENDYLVSEKTDGVRYLILMTREEETGRPITLAMDRTLSFVQIPIKASSLFFSDRCIFDAEIVWSTKEVFFFDAIVVCGVRLASHSYRDRLSVLERTVYSGKERGQQLNNILMKKSCIGSDSMCLCAKKFVAKTRLEEVWAKRSENCDGLIFALGKELVEIGTSRSTFKWKNYHTLDVRIVMHGSSFSLFVNSDCSDEEVLLSEAVSVSKVILLDAKEGCPSPTLSGQIWECLLEKEDENSLSLSPFRRRDDKNAANTAKTCLATVKNFRENISLSYLSHACSSSLFTEEEIDSFLH